MGVAGGHVVAEHHVLEKREADIGFAPEAAGGRRFFQVVAKGVQNMHAPEGHVSLGGADLLFDLTLFHHQGLEKGAVGCIDQFRLHGE